MLIAGGAVVGALFLAKLWKPRKEPTPTRKEQSPSPLHPAQESTSEKPAPSEVTTPVRSSVSTSNKINAKYKDMFPVGCKDRCKLAGRCNLSFCVGTPAWPTSSCPAAPCSRKGPRKTFQHAAGDCYRAAQIDQPVAFKYLFPSTHSRPRPNGQLCKSTNTECSQKNG